MLISIPKFPRGDKVCCVYKITFDSTNFYIGGTKNFKNRANYWKCLLLKGCPKNKNIKALINNCSSVCMEVVEHCVAEKVTDREDFYIKKYAGNNLLLNRCPSAFDNAGIKLTADEIVRLKDRLVKCKKSPIPISNEERLRLRNVAISKGLAKKIVVTDMQLNVVFNARSKSEAVDFSKVDRDTITEVLKGFRQSAKGYRFREIDKFGNTITPPVLQRKKTILIADGRRSELVIKRLKESGFLDIAKHQLIELNHNKRVPVLMYDRMGNYIDTLISYQEAAKRINTDSSNVSKVVNGKRGHIKGFIFKRA